MKRDLSRFESGHFHLLIIGGGIFGAAAAWEAVSRGLNVALLEKGDFGAATTANSYKTAHGGMRYLQHADIPRVRESSRERSALIRIAPHLVYPLPVVIPTYGRGMAGKSVLRAGFGVYDLVTADRNRGIVDPDRRIPRARFLSRDQVISRFPGANSEDLTGGALFHDGQMYNPSRLVLAFVRSAADAGAAVANYCEVLTPVLEADRVTGATVRDLESGDTFRITADQVLNAAGPWAFDWLSTGVGLEFDRQRPAFSRDVGLVTRKRLPEPLGLACRTSTRDAETLVDRGARHLFLLPWRGYTTVGVWHGVYRGSIDRVEVTLAEIEQFVAEANDAYEGFDLTLDDISMVNTGLILFGEEDQEASSHKFGHRSLVIDHERTHGIKGLTTLIGVRATTARGMAETVVDGMAARFSSTVSGSRTETTPLRGGQYERFETLVEETLTGLNENGRDPEAELVARALAHGYGTDAREVLEIAAGAPQLAQTLPGTRTLAAEVVYGVREEMARTVLDVLTFRTDAGTAEAPSEAAIRIAAEIVARELGLDTAARDQQIDEAKKFFSRHGALREFDQDTAPGEDVSSTVAGAGADGSAGTG